MTRRLAGSLPPDAQRAEYRDHLERSHDRLSGDKLDALTQIVELAAVDGQVVSAALALDFADLEDAVQACAGAASAADYVATRNLKDFARGPLPAVSPAELLALVPAPAALHRGGRQGPIERAGTLAPRAGPQWQA